MGRHTLLFLPFQQDAHGGPSTYSQVQVASTETSALDPPLNTKHAHTHIHQMNSAPAVLYWKYLEERDV